MIYPCGCGHEKADHANIGMRGWCNGGCGRCACRTFWKIGTTQAAVLKCLAEHGQWHAMCGWTWSTPSGTVKILEGLVARGVVVKTDERMRWAGSYVTRPVYRVKRP